MECFVELVVVVMVGRSHDCSGETGACLVQVIRFVVLNRFLDMADCGCNVLAGLTAILAINGSVSVLEFVGSFVKTVEMVNVLGRSIGISTGQQCHRRVYECKQNCWDEQGTRNEPRREHGKPRELEPDGAGIISSG
jgi:hypothetical protein